MTTKSIGRLTLCLVLCLGIGVLEGLVTRPQIAGWYAGLVKPSWTPPPILFPIVWTALYVMMAFTLWRLWDRVPPSAARTTAVRLFVLQLAINATWSPVFFGWHGIRAGLAIILLLLAAFDRHHRCHRQDRSPRRMAAGAVSCLGRLRDHHQCRCRRIQLIAWIGNPPSRQPTSTASSSCDR